MVKTTEIDGIIKDGKLHIFRSGSKRCECYQCSLKEECASLSNELLCIVFEGIGHFECAGELMAVKRLNPNLN